MLELAAFARDFEKVLLLLSPPERRPRRSASERSIMSETGGLGKATRLDELKEVAARMVLVGGPFFFNCCSSAARADCSSAGAGSCRLLRTISERMSSVSRSRPPSLALEDPRRCSVLDFFGVFRESSARHPRGSLRVRSACHTSALSVCPRLYEFAKRPSKDADPFACLDPRTSLMNLFILLYEK